ncbi:MAG: formate/nitrite transporter family protein [Rhodospirillaceae bacterium]|nr:formate/nitrite transporter family protein [Rhodospirillaceae bacterium]
MDALLPTEIALKAEETGAAKARMPAHRLFALAVLAGAFIAFGCIFYAVALAGASDAMPWGAARVLAGFVFSLGLILVVIGGAELFTGNALMVMALAARRIRTADMARAWAIVYAGNLVGAIGTAVMLFLSGQYGFGGGSVGVVYLAAANTKIELPLVDALFLGVLCNVLVCLAVWLTLGAHSTADKILAILFPIAAFVAAGFEHSVANMFFLPLALMIQWWAPESFWQIAGIAPDTFGAIDMTGALRNLIAVTLGNIVGGGILVGAVYWFVYLRHRGARPGG